MTPEQFVAKWSKIQQKETAVSQSHFNDVCCLTGHAPPLEYDPEGHVFSFETQTVKPGGSKGFADVGIFAYYRVVITDKSVALNFNKRIRLPERRRRRRNG